MQQEIEESYQFAQEAHHFLPMARQHLSKALAVVEGPDKGPGSGDYPVEFVRKATLDFRGREVCLFVTYVPGDRLLPGARAMVEALAASGLTVVVCCAVKDMSLKLDLSGLEGAALIVRRKNGGYDFAVWAAILGELPELWSAERLFFVNDSILGPLNGLDQVLSRIRASDADFLALTESYDIRHHSQSYFFVLQKEAMQCSEIRRFWRGVRVEKTKMAVIEKYEVSLLHIARDVAGLGTEVLFSYDCLFPGVNWSKIKRLNPTHYLWEHLLHSGFPFVKAELLHANPLELNIHHWEQIVALYGGNVSLFREHLARMTETRGAPAARNRYGKWKLVRRLVGDEQFFEMCDAWSRARWPWR